MLFPELAQQLAIYAYSFILTNLDVSSPDKAAAVEHWYRHRTTVENIFRDSKLGAALRHLPSGYPQVNLAWMWGALLAASMAAWLHQLTAITAGEDILAGHGVARAGASQALTRLSELTGIPVATTFMGKGTISDRHPNALGAVGFMSHDFDNFAFDKSDLIIAVGYELQEFAPARINPKGDTPVLHIHRFAQDTDAAYPVACSIEADIGLAL